MTPEQRALAGRLGAELSWANTGDKAARKKRTAPGREAAEARFDRMVIEKHGVLPPAEHAKCAEAYRNAHYAAMTLKSIQARAAKKAAPNPKTS